MVNFGNKDSNISYVIDVDSELRLLRHVSKCLMDWGSIGPSWILLVTKLIDIAGLIISISLKYPLIYHFFTIHHIYHLYIIHFIVT